MGRWFLVAVELGTAYLSLVADSRGLAKSVRKGLGEVDVEAERTGKSAGGKLGGGLVKGIGVASAAVGVLGGVVAGIALKGGISRALNIEDAQGKLKGLGHSTESVKTIMDNALASVKGTAFGLDAAAGIAASAVAAGVKPGQDLERTLKLVADASTIAGTDMGDMGQIFNKVASSNKVQGEVINQLNERGIPILQLLGEEMGVTAEEAAKMASSGKVDFDTFRNAMENGMGGAALKSGETTRGAMSNTMAALSRAGESFLGGVFPMFKDGLTGITGFLDNLGPAAEKAGEWLGGALSTAKDMAQGLFDLIVKGDFTTKFREAFNMDEDSGLVTFLLGLRETAITVFNEVKGGISAFVAAFQDGGSDVTSSGFAGVLERLGLAARATFDYIKDTVIPALMDFGGWIVKNKDWLTAIAIVVGTLVVGIGGYIKVMAAWKAITTAATALQATFNAVMAANPIGLIILAIAALVAGLVWFFTQTETGKAIVENVWGAIKTAISAVADWWTGTAWPAISAVITWFAEAFQTAGSIVTGVWTAIKDGISAAWNWVRDNVFAAIMWWVDVVKIAFGLYRDAIVTVWNVIQTAISTAWNWIRDNVFAKIMWWIDAIKIGFGLYRDALVTAWNAVKDGLSTGWSWIRDNVFAPLKAGVGLIGDAFEGVRDRIGTAWDALKEIAAKPVNFILGTVYNDGIRAWWNKISGAVGLDSLSLPKASLVQFAQGSEDHRAQIARGGSMRLWAEPETGGEAYIPLAASKRGRSTAILANVAQRFGYNLSSYADGGIWNSLGGLVGDAWDTAKNLGRSIWDTGAMAVEIVKDPVGAIKKALESGVIAPLMSRIGVGGDFVKILGTMPGKFAGGLADKVKSMLGAQQQSSMGNATPGAGVGVGAMTNLLHALIPGARVTSGMRAGARTAGFGNLSMHALGRAIDIGAGGGKSLSQIWDIINAAYGSRSQELLYTPKGANQILRGGKRGGTSGVTAKNHFSHVHWAMANGGVLFDNGGWMNPGDIGVNQSRGPEPVFTTSQWDILESNLRNGNSGQVSLADESVQRLASAILMGAAQVSTNALAEQARDRSGYRGRG